MKVNSVMKLTVLYLIAGLIWIYFSDKLLSLFVANDILELSRIQTWKGFFYVASTAALLYILLHKYNTELTDKVAKLQESKEALRKSEENYRLLFDSSPTPIFIYDPKTEQILKVNNAALSYYGYTKGEFSHMSILQIEDDDELDVDKLEEKLQIPKREGMLHTHGIHRHKRKDGKQIYVYMQGSVIQYKGVEAHIAMINDITNQLQYIERVELQNEKLNKIAWMQSHVVRAPLASLMGLVDILKEHKEDLDDLIPKIESSATQLDDVIKNIAKDAGVSN